MATVTLSLVSINFCRVSWRSLLFPTAGMMSGRLRGGILLSVHDDARDVGKLGMRLRRARFGIVVASEEIVRAGRRNALQEIGDGGEVGVTGARVVERACADEVELRPMVGVAIDLRYCSSRVVIVDGDIRRLVAF